MTDADRLDDWAARIEREGCRHITARTRTLLSDLAEQVRADAQMLRALAPYRGLSPWQVTALRRLREVAQLNGTGNAPRPKGVQQGTLTTLEALTLIERHPTTRWAGQPVFRLTAVGLAVLDFLPGDAR